MALPELKPLTTDTSTTTTNGIPTGEKRRSATSHDSGAGTGRVGNPAPSSKWGSAMIDGGDATTNSMMSREKHDCYLPNFSSSAVVADHKKPAKSATKAPPVENIGDFLQFGYYSIFVIVLYETLLFPQMGNMTFMVYGGSAPRVVACGNHSFRELVDGKEACHALNNIQQQHSVHNNYSAASGEALCGERGIELEAQFGSLAMEFGFYCERKVEVKKSISVLMFGVLCGSLIFGQASDSFGRKKVLLLMHVGMLLFDSLASTATSLVQFTALQFCTMLFVGGHNTVMHVFLLENMPKRHRVWVLTALSYSPNYVLFAGLAYATQEWRMLLRMLALLNIPAFIGLLFAYESPRWLIQKAKLERAHQVLSHIEHINGTANEERLNMLDELIQNEVQANEAKKRKRKYYFYHLFYTGRLCLYSATISYALLCTSVVAYALLYNIEELSGSIYLNSVLFGLIRYAMNLTAGLVDFAFPTVGRKRIHTAAISFMIVMLGAAFLTKLLPLEHDPNYSAAATMLLRLTTLSAAAMCSQLYMVNAVVTSELFPTAIRNLAASFVQIASRTGSVFGPHLFYLAGVWPPLPFAVMLALLAGDALAFGALIPETKHSPMADHMPSRGGKKNGKKGKKVGGDGKPSEQPQTSSGDLVGIVMGGDGGLIEEGSVRRAMPTTMRTDIPPSSARLTEEC